MVHTKPQEIIMLEILIENAASGKKIDLHAEPVRNVVKLEREGKEIDTVILSMRYTGTIQENPFKFEKHYSFTEDEAQSALECLLVANNRLQTDYDRLKEAGVAVKEAFFTYQNAFIGLSGDASVKRPALRLQDFIHLFRAGVQASVDVTLKRPAITFKHEGEEKKGFGYLASFVFTNGKETTAIQKRCWSRIG
ncbi:MAG: hypothetical protein JSV50_17920 [Desulfobacteraceae bacterium]|nr:MAG: hypothetical protein JSV50_17920 [Desulfobacteraceae bacterium]